MKWKDVKYPTVIGCSLISIMRCWLRRGWGRRRFSSRFCHWHHWNGSRQNGLAMSTIRHYGWNSDSRLSFHEFFSFASRAAEPKWDGALSQRAPAHKPPLNRTARSIHCKQCALRGHSLGRLNFIFMGEGRGWLCSCAYIWSKYTWIWRYLEANHS